MNPTFLTAYQAYCKQKSLETVVVDLPEGAKGFWLGNPKAKEVLVYIHGGGFVMPGSPFHLMLYQTVLDTLKDANKDLGVFFISYTLVPHAVYPTQIRQCVEGVRHILESHSPSDVILSGDSAGGNLALAVVSHLSHPHSAIPPLELSEPLRGLMVMAPWTSFKYDWPSNTINEWKDMLTVNGLEKWSDEYLGPAGKKGTKSDYYIEAVTAPTSWWEGAKVKDTLVLAGGEEILRDPIVEWAEKFKSVNANTTIVVAKTECHDEAIYGPLIMDMSEKETGTALKEWLKAKL